MHTKRTKYREKGVWSFVAPPAFAGLVPAAGAAAGAAAAAAATAATATAAQPCDVRV
eukprot:evm.model.NODE_39505_length_72863_cov_22.203917.22